MIAASMLDLVGQTPLVRVEGSWAHPPGAPGPPRATVWAKMEHLNPRGSVTDRICLAMIEDGEARGVLAPPGPIIEPTSGNTGIGHAWVAAVKAYRLILTMPESMSLERRQLLESYGAEIVLTPAEEQMEAPSRGPGRPRRVPLARSCLSSATNLRTLRSTPAPRPTRSCTQWKGCRSTPSSPAWARAAP